MYRLFYHHYFPGVWMLELKAKPITEVCYKSEGELVVLQHEREVVGYNLFNMPLLSSGYHDVNSKLSLINSKLKAGFCEVLEEQVNPLFVAEIVSVETIKEGVYLCRVDCKDEERQVVTKADNVREKMKVIIALPGAVLYNGTIVEESTVYGNRSTALLCSQRALWGKEADLGKIIELKAECVVGGIFKGEI